MPLIPTMSFIFNSFSSNLYCVFITDIFTSEKTNHYKTFITNQKSIAYFCPQYNYKYNFKILLMIRNGND